MENSDNVRSSMNSLIAHSFIEFGPRWSLLGFVPNSFANFRNNKIVSFSKDCFLSLDTQVMVRNLLFYANDFIFISWVKILFSFRKITLYGQDTYLQLGLLLSSFGASL